MALDGSGHLTIPAWPCDCSSQKPIITSLISDIELQDTLIRGYGKKLLQIFSETPPSLAQWQTQWLLQGNSLPLPNGIECIWFDTSGNTYGAQYSTVNGYVYPVEMLRYRGLKLDYKDVSSPAALPTNLGGTAAGLLHWNLVDNGSGSPGAVSYLWNIPTQLLGKNYFVKFYIPVYATMTLNWTVWYENTNLYNTLYGGAGEAGFGRTVVSSNQGIIEWTAEIPAGGVVSTVEMRVAATAAGGTISSFPLILGSNNGTVGRTSAEFILKAE